MCMNEIIISEFLADCTVYILIKFHPKMFVSYIKTKTSRYPALF